MAKLPKSLTKVTGFSKLIALFVIVGFLVSAFYAGILFNQKYSSGLTFVTPTPTSAVSEATSCTTDNDCVLADLSESNFCCPNLKCADFSKESEQAYNADWLTNRKFTECKGRMCPMIATICTREISEENSHYSAKCISHVCTKVRS